ncbi:hypothetical protein HDU86_006724 [Geranomyces michiganensis]|nr:hypothetical protein HDU86_006724 [Geranomyces michiganensis]
MAEPTPMDVDAPAPESPSSSAVSKGKGPEVKKRFEVKKVRPQQTNSPTFDFMGEVYSQIDLCVHDHVVECCGFVGLGYVRRPLACLQIVGPPSNAPDLGGPSSFQNAGAKQPNLRCIA